MTETLSCLVTVNHFLGQFMRKQFIFFFGVAFVNSPSVADVLKGKQYNYLVHLHLGGQRNALHLLH